MITESSIYGAIEEHAAKVGALAFPLILWPAGVYFLGKSGAVRQISPEYGAMAGLLLGIGHAWFSKRAGEEDEVPDLAAFVPAEDDVLALPDNVVTLDDYRGACACGDYGEVSAEKAVSEVGKGFLLLSAVGLGILAYELHRSSKTDRGAQMGRYIDSISREDV